MVYYSLGESQAFHLLSYRPGANTSDSLDADGYFLVLLAPQPETEQEEQPKDLILVLDRSGSMEGEKFQQAQEALRYILNHLNPGGSLQPDRLQFRRTELRRQPTPGSGGG